jgi:hypothetical protein
MLSQAAKAYVFERKKEQEKTIFFDVCAIQFLFASCFPGRRPNILRSTCEAGSITTALKHSLKNFPPGYGYLNHCS